jgi:hypothetical protein
MSLDPTKPVLSAVISTVEPPNAVIRGIEYLINQVAAIHGELIIVTGASETSSFTLPHVRVYSMPGASVFACRAMGLRIASADIVALTEDHCIPAADWCARIVQDFAKWPDLVLLGGCVANGSSERIEDLMNYWMTFATFAPGQVVARHPCVAQFIVRASVVGRHLEPGELEDRVIKKFETIPGAIRLDRDLCVRHLQSHGFWNTFVMHYHNGRATGGFSPRRVGGRSLSVWRSLRLAWIDAQAHIHRTAQAFSAGNRSTLAIAGYCFLISPLVLAHGIGEFVGYHKGPGKSPGRLV